MNTLKLTFTPVESSNIGSVAYDSEASALYVSFLNNTTYRYESVPQDIYEAFLAAESKGKYFYANIRNAYTATRIDLPKEGAA